MSGAEPGRGRAPGGRRWLLLVLLLGTCVAGCRTSRPDVAPEPPAPGAGVAAGETREGAIEVDGRRRTYLLHVPAGYDGTRALPLVLMFHGGGGSAQRFLDESRWDRKADEAGFLLVMPDGARPDPGRRASFTRNPQTWNDGSGRYYAGEQDIDDVAFAGAIIDEVAARYRVDRRRVYAGGFSNGSSMAFRCGVELSGRIAAIAPVGSSGLRLSDPQFGRPVPMIYIHGVEDPRNPLEGGEVKVYGKIDHRPPVRTAVESWARANGCSPDPVTLRDAGGVRAVGYRRCRRGADVDFYLVEGLGHTWPGGASRAPALLVGPSSDNLDANSVIWEFFSGHALP